MQPYITAQKNYTEVPDLSLFRQHTHDDYEIFCFVSGDAKYYVEGTIYELQPYDILLIKKSETHALLINQPLPYERYVINFNALALPDEQRDTLISAMEAKPLGKHSRIPADKQQQATWLHYLNHIVFADSFATRRLYLTVLLTELCKNLGTADRNSPTASENEKLIEYINRNLMSVSSLDDVCRRFFISKTHLNRKWKAMTGSTVWDYVIVKRLIAAKDMLQGGIRPSEVAEKCGYMEYSTFYRAYKNHFGTSPKDDYHK